MNMKTIEDVKMDKKEFKKLSKGKAYDEVYDPLFNIAADGFEKLEKAGELLDQAEVDVQEAKKDAEASKKLADEATARADEATARADEATARADEATARADEATARADEATARAESAENKVNEARAHQNEAVSLFNIIDTEIGLKEEIRQSAVNKFNEADEEFGRAMGEILHLSAKNSAINKATVNCEDEEFAREFEGFKKSRMDENNRQKRLDKESARKMRDISVENRLIAEGCTRRINFLEEQKNKALIELGKAFMNMDFSE